MDDEEARLGFQLPTDYKAFIAQYNNGSLLTDTRSEILFEPIQNMPIYPYEDSPEYIVFANNGGQDAYVFNTSTVPTSIGISPWVGLESDIIMVGYTLQDLIDQIHMEDELD
jgi:hypothetical protein